MNKIALISTSLVLGAVIAAQVYNSNNKIECKLTNKLNDNIVCVKSSISQQSEYSQFVNDLVLAQAVEESNLSNKPSRLAINDNNLFGIKCSTKVKNCVIYKTTEYIKGKKLTVNASFAHFDSISECIRFRLNMFKLPRYKNVINCISFSDCAVRIQKSGYATDPRYAIELIRVYGEYIK